MVILFCHIFIIFYQTVGHHMYFQKKGMTLGKRCMALGKRGMALEKKGMALCKTG